MKGSRKPSNASAVILQLTMTKQLYENLFALVQLASEIKLRIYIQLAF